MRPDKRNRTKSNNNHHRRNNNDDNNNESNEIDRRLIAVTRNAGREQQRRRQKFLKNTNENHSCNNKIEHQPWHRISVPTGWPRNDDDRDNVYTWDVSGTAEWTIWRTCTVMYLCIATKTKTKKKKKTCICETGDNKNHGLTGKFGRSIVRARSWNETERKNKKRNKTNENEKKKKKLN